MEFSQPWRTHQLRAMGARVALLGLVVIAVITTLSLLLTRGHVAAPSQGKTTFPNDENEAGQVESCNSSSCRLSALLLKETMGGSPCEDFYSYVCSGWLRKPSFSSTRDTQAILLFGEARSRLTQMRHSFTRKGPTTSTWNMGNLFEGANFAPLTPSSVKAATLYNDCVAASAQRNADALLNFMDGVGIGFTHRVEDAVHKAFMLDFFYNIKTLFDLHRHATWRRPDDRPLLALSRRSDMDDWQLARDDMRRKNVYRSFVRRFVDTILAQENKTVTDKQHLTVSRVVATEETVLALASVIPDEDPERFHAIVPLSAYASSLPSVPLTGVKNMAVGDSAMLVYLHFLKTKIASQDLAAYVAWEVVRNLGPLADRSMSHGPADETCFTAVYRLMPYSTVIPYLEELDDAGRWEEADLVFKDVAKSFIDFLGKRGISHPAENATFHLDFPTASALEKLYEELRVKKPTQKNPFLFAYLGALSHLRQKELTSVAEAAPFTAPPTSRVQVTRKGQGRVPLPWLLPPRFGSLSPPALNYGGLGLALVAALARHAPVHNTWTECLAHLEPSVPLKDDDAAVRLALATEAIVGFVDHHSQLGRRQRLPGLEMMNEERLFFVGLCAGLCAKGDSLAPHRCHLAARNSPRFAQAFGCRAGSYMNPRQRCPYPSRHQRE